MSIKNLFQVLLAFSLAIFVSSCEEIDTETPTNELMEGVWQLSDASEGSENITDKVTTFFPTFVHMDDKNSVNSTAGPLFMYIVYGDSRFVNITSKLDQVFSYADLSFTEGEWFIDKNKVVDNFTIEMKLLFPTMETVTEIFDLLDVNLPEFVEDGMDLVIYHRFKNITVEIDEDNPDIMVWEFTPQIVADYNTKDKYGDKILYTGVNVTEFSKCRLEFHKKSKSLIDLVQDYNRSLEVSEFIN